MISLQQIMEAPEKKNIEFLINELNTNLHWLAKLFFISDFPILRGILSKDKIKILNTKFFEKYNIRKNRHTRDGSNDVVSLVNIYGDQFYPEFPSRSEILFCTFDTDVAYQYVKNYNTIFYVFPDKKCELFSYPWDSLYGYQSDEMSNIENYYEWGIEEKLDLEIKAHLKYRKLFIFMIDLLAGFGYLKGNIGERYESFNYEEDFKEVVSELLPKYLKESQKNNIVKDYAYVLQVGFDNLEKLYFDKINTDAEVQESDQEIWITEGQYYIVNIPWFKKNIRYDEIEKKFKKIL